MDLKSMASTSTGSDWLTARSQELNSDLTHTGRYFRWIGRKWIWSPSFQRCLILSLSFLYKEAKHWRQRFGLRVAKAQWTAKEMKRNSQLRRWRWSMKWKAFLSSVPSTAHRMYWRHILRHYPRIEQFRMWTNYRSVMNRIQSMSPSSQLKIEQRKSGESDGIT